MRPTFDRLTELYIDQRLTSRQIGELMHVSKTEVLRWLKSYGIQARDPHNSMSNRGLVIPTKDELIELVQVRHCGYAEIAAMYKCDTSMIGHWLKKYGIPRPKIWDTRYKNARPVLPDERTLRDLYEVRGISIENIGLMYGVGESVISARLHKHGIHAKAGGYNALNYLCKDGHLVKSVYEQRIDDWLYEHNIEHVYEPRLFFDRRYRADFLARGHYIEMWGVEYDAQYDVRRAHKTNLYKEHNLPLIQISVRQMMNSTWRKPLLPLLQSV